MNSNYPSILFEVYDFLIEYTFELCGGEGEDGRVVSIEKEKDVVKVISDKFPSIVPPPRHWFDIALIYNDQLIHCNIKISTGKNDNANQKKGIIHSLTNLHEKNIKNNMNFNFMHDLIMDNVLENRRYDREYYYIYLDKKDKMLSYVLFATSCICNQTLAISFKSIGNKRKHVQISIQRMM